MTLQTVLTEREIALLFDAVHSKEKHWRDVAKRPLQGYGKATEKAKKEERALLADEYSALASRLVELTI